MDKYCGTLVIDVPEDAVGSFTLDLVQDLPYTQAQDRDGLAIVPFATTAAIITIPCLDDDDCDDHNMCTDDSCGPAFRCVYVNIDEACDDGNACTMHDTCVQGMCVGGLPLDCDDENVCTDDSCDPASGCVHLDNNDPCDTGNPATNGTCVNGRCVGEPANGGFTLHHIMAMINELLVQEHIWNGDHEALLESLHDGQLGLD